MNNIYIKIRKWIKKNNSSTLELSLLLNYKSDAVYKWLLRENIPNNMEKHINEILKRNKKVENKR